MSLPRMKDRTNFVQDISACHYERLGVSPGVDAETLRQAFRSRSKALHPDTTMLPKDEARQAFQRLKESYDVLLTINRSRADQAAVSVDQPAPSTSRPPVDAWQGIGERRPLSGGEWFSLLLLTVALLLSLLLGLGVAMTQGRQWQVSPAWLANEQTQEATSGPATDVPSAVGNHSTEPALPASA